MSSEDRVVAAFHSDRDDVYRYLVVLGLAPAEAQEATQEAYLLLLNAARDGKEIHNMRAWVFRVAHNLGLKALKKNRNRQPLESDLALTLEDRRQSPEAVMLQRERMSKLRSALETLSPQQRQTLYLRAEGLQYQEIAAAMGIGISTVGEFLSRAMSRLRKATQ